MQQRGISAAALEALLDFGRAKPAGNGREIVFFARKARRVGSGSEFEKLRVPRFTNLTPNLIRNLTPNSKTYAILESDGTVITVGHRYRRIPRGR
ncbi:MAG TPA: hypothetical protein VIV54_21050 [Burkholderiales bacterium]